MRVGEVRVKPRMVRVVGSSCEKGGKSTWKNWCNGQRVQFGGRGTLEVDGGWEGTVPTLPVLKTLAGIWFSGQLHQPHATVSFFSQLEVHTARVFLGTVGR